MVSKSVHFLALAACLLAQVCHAGQFAAGSSNAFPTQIAPASDDAERAMKRFRLQKGLKVDLFAAEPMLANPVAFCLDEQGRMYVAETFRLHNGVTDIRGHMSWLNEELASTTVEERVAYMTKHEGDRIGEYTRYSDRVRMLLDADGDGRADGATVFANGFNGIADGIGAGLLARRGSLYYANIPNLWILRDETHDGIADSRRAALTGFGVRVGFLGHDLHGLRMGPDGKLYFSVGDRGAHVLNKERKVIANHEEGAVYRCDLDGSNLEIFARGLRNPQELAFDEYGNLWTGDNNSDGGDPARWVYVVEGGDSGWRVGYQFLNNPSRGVWLTERMCYPQWEGQAAYIVPPIANIGNGPSGLTYYPGAGLSSRYENHFFLADFRGTTGSGVHSFSVKARGASFDVVDRHEFIWEVLVTDCDFGYDGNFYISDWVEGWRKPGKGRIYRITDPEHVKDRPVRETKEFFARGIHNIPVHKVVPLLSHVDMRVRQEAQFAIVENGPATAARTLTDVLRDATNRFARIHAVWGLGQISFKSQLATDTLNRSLLDHDPEIRAQGAKVLGESRRGDIGQLAHLTSDESARVRFFAAQALGKTQQPEAIKPLLKVLRTNDDRDPYLRQAAAHGLATILRNTNTESLHIVADKFQAITDASLDQSDAVRLGVLIALREVESPMAALFLSDSNPRVVAEAARAINDIPIAEALPELAALIEDTDKILAFPAGDTEHPGPRDAVLRRVLNANFRVGESNHAVALATFAAASKAPESFRAEALAMLADWAEPSDRDRITGLWRPLEARDLDDAGDALQPLLGALQKSPSDTIKFAATRTAGALNISGTAFDPLAIVKDKSMPANMRAEALRSMAHQHDEHLLDAVKIALTDEDETVRKAATTINAQLNPEAALSQLREVLANGTVAEKQNAFATLGSIDTPGADGLLSELMTRLLAGAVQPELQLDLIDAAAKHQNPVVKASLEKYERARPAGDELRDFRVSLVGGNAEEGRRIFLDRPEASCVRCHKFAGEGGEVGPDLTGIGARKDRDYILESITYPNRQIAAGFENVIVTLKNGTTYAGLLRNENKDTLEINSPEDGVVRMRKSDIKSRDRGLSGMPEELRQVLSKQDVRNLVEFLASSKTGTNTPATATPPVTLSPAPVTSPATATTPRMTSEPAINAPAPAAAATRANEQGAGRISAEAEAQRKLRQALHPEQKDASKSAEPKIEPTPAPAPSPAQNPAPAPAPEKKPAPAE